MSFLSRNLRASIWFSPSFIPSAIKQVLWPNCLCSLPQGHAEAPAPKLMICGDEAFGRELVQGSEFLMNEICALINKQTLE